MKYIWGLEEKKQQIEKSVKLPQRGVEYIFEPLQGKRVK